MNQEVIEEIKNGNLKYLDKIYLEVKPAFLSYARKSFQRISTEEVEDIYQDTIIDLYKNIQRGLLTEIEISFSSYVIHIGKMKLIRLSEQKQRNQHTEIEEIASLPADTTESVDWIKVEKLVEFIFGNMDESCKDILELYYFKHLSMDAIAQKLGYKNADVVKSKKHRCINRISERVSKMNNEN